MKRIIKHKSILKSPGLHNVVGGAFCVHFWFCGLVCLFVLVWFIQHKNLFPFIRENAESFFGCVASTWVQSHPWKWTWKILEHSTIINKSESKIFNMWNMTSEVTFSTIFLKSFEKIICWVHRNYSKLFKIAVASYVLQQSFMAMAAELLLPRVDPKIHAYCWYK